MCLTIVGKLQRVPYFRVKPTLSTESQKVMKEFRVVTILASILLPVPVWAGGYATARFGGEHGHAASEHVTSLYYNPAGLAFGKGTRVYAEGLFAYRYASYLRRANAIDNFGSGTPDNDPAALAANSGEAELSNVLVSPFLGVVSDLGIDGLGVGAGFYVPFGGQASWQKNDDFANNAMYPGAVDGTQRWASIEGYHRVLYGTVAVAYRLPGPRLSFGIGFNLVRQELETLRARNADGTDDLVGAGGSLKEGTTLLDGSNTSFAIGAGVMWQPIERLRIGLSYQSMPGFGESKLDGQLTSQFGNGSVGLVDTQLSLVIPDLIRFGVSYKVSPKVEVHLAGDYTRWSTFDRHCLLVRPSEGDPGECIIDEDGSAGDGAGTVLLGIPRDWKDTFGVRVGGSYWFSEPFELFGGFGYDSNAIPDDTLEPGFFDMDKLITTAGVRYQILDQKLMLTGSLTNVYYFKRETQPRMTAPELPSRNPDGAGVYEQSINFLTVGAQVSF